MLDRKFFIIITLIAFAVLFVVTIPSVSNNNNNSKTGIENSEVTSDKSSQSTSSNNNNNGNKKKRQKPSRPLLRYEFEENEEDEDGVGGISKPTAEMLRESCSLQDLEKVAYFNSNSKKKFAEGDAGDAENSTSSNNYIPASKNGWLFRNWCSKYTKLSSPFPKRRSSKKISKEDKEQDDTINDSPLPFRLDSDQLRSLFQDQVTLFVGDSVVRNHFVLTMARLCNEEHRGKCMIMMPTYEYDIVKPEPWRRGPLGCIPREAFSTTAIPTPIPPTPEPTTDEPSSQQQNNPGFSGGYVKKGGKGRKGKNRNKNFAGNFGGGAGDETTNNNNNNNNDVENSNSRTRDAEVQSVPTTASSVSSKVDSDNLFEAAANARKTSNQNTLTDCYKNGSSFSFVPAPGLTTTREPRRSERKSFLKKGVITPLIRMEVNGAVFFYVPVNTPKQIVKFGKWLAMKAGKSAVGTEILKARTVFVSTGPHLSVPEMNSSIMLLKPALTFIQSSLSPEASVILSETTHLLNGPPWFADFIDGVMDQWKRELTSSSSTGSSTNSPTSSSTSNENSGGENQNANNSNNNDADTADTDSSTTTTTKKLENPVVDFVPQRFVTIGGYWQTANNPNAGMVYENEEQEKLRKNRRTCPYYDAQHPASECQEVLTELMLLTAYSSRARKMRNGGK